MLCRRRSYGVSKIPFGSLIVPLLKNHENEIDYFCAPCLFGSGVYIGCMSLVSIVVTILDLYRLYAKNGMTACILDPCPALEKGREICPQLKKGWKMTMCGVNLNFYALLLGGVLSDSPALMMPYLFFQVINILLFTMYMMIILFTCCECFKKRYIFILGEVSNFLTFTVLV